MLIIPTGVPGADIEALVPEELRLPRLPGATVPAAVALAVHGPGSTLVYGELAAVVATLGPDRVPIGLVTSIWVDSERSRVGGRSEWRVPKEPAVFDWREEAAARASVRDADGGLLLRAGWKPARPRLPIPIRGRFAGALGGELRLARLSGWAALAPVRVDVELPPASPLATSVSPGHRIGFAGHATLCAGPAQAPAGRASA